MALTAEKEALLQRIIASMPKVEQPPLKLAFDDARIARAEERYLAPV